MVGSQGCFSSQLASSARPSFSSSLSAIAVPQQLNIKYEIRQLPTSEVHIVTIPANGRFVVVPAIAQQVKYLQDFAQQEGAIAVLNGGFFDPENQLSTAYVMREGRMVADPTQNPRLMNSPELAPYLNKILQRSEFRRYQCGTTWRYAIASRLDPIPAGCQLQDALGAGPRLLPQLTLEPEGFFAQDNGVVVRDALGSQQPNARTAVGITTDGNLVWVMVAQKSSVTGMSLSELAAFLHTLGIVDAINLDGGSSSSLYFREKTVYGKVDAAGQKIQRPVKSVLLVKMVN